MAVIAPINKPLHAAQNTEPLIVIRLPENLSQSGWCPFVCSREVDCIMESGGKFGFWKIMRHLTG